MLTTSTDQENQNGEDASPELSRRNLLAGVGAGVLGSMVLGQSAFAAGAHDHSKHSPSDPDLLEVLDHCVSAGRLCIAHCLVSFQEGDTSLAICGAASHDILDRGRCNSNAPELASPGQLPGGGPSSPDGA